VAMTGTVAMWCTPTAPGGWILCQGQAVSKTQYSALYSIISDTFRNPSNSDQSTFNVPDFRDVLPVGSSATKALASKGGAATVTLVTANLASHTHTLGNHTHVGANHTHSMQGHTHGMDHYHLIGAGQFNHTHSDAGHTHTYSMIGGSGPWALGGGGQSIVNFNTGSASANIQANTLPQGNTVYASQTNGAWANTGGPSVGDTGFSEQGLTTGGPSTNTSDPTGSATPFGILPPYLAIMFIIKA
jgi:microcystin-dependent protein